jgi:hypothetical protein
MSKVFISSGLSRRPCSPPGEGSCFFYLVLIVAIGTNRHDQQYPREDGCWDDQDHNECGWPMNVRARNRAADKKCCPGRTENNSGHHRSTLLPAEPCPTNAPGEDENHSGQYAQTKVAVAILAEIESKVGEVINVKRCNSQSDKACSRKGNRPPPSPLRTLGIH